MTAPVILLLAGEPSGDAHGSAVAEALRRRWPECRLIGTGGEKMARAGVELFAKLDELAVMGFVEVISRLGFFRRLEARVDRLVRTGSVDLVLPVDYPGFNLRATVRARAAGVPVLYYIAPQVWAWKADRARVLARAAARIAVILPFEEEIFRREGGEVVFVGHPLLDRPDDVPSREEFCRAAGLDPRRPILALFPGSRAQEVRRHLAPFVGAGERLRAERPELQVAIARAGGVELEGFDGPEGTRAGIRDVGPGAPPVVVTSDARALLRHARAALVKSGTTTLEAALEGTPFVVAYRAHPVTFRLARRLVRVDRIALANLVAGAPVVPEILQNAVTPERLADALRPLLDETEGRRRTIEGLRRVRERLGTPGAADRVAALAAEILERGR